MLAGRVGEETQERTSGKATVHSHIVSAISRT